MDKSPNMYAMEEIKVSEEELKQYKCIQGEEILEHLPEDYTPSSTAFDSLKNFFESFEKIDGKIPAFNRSALVKGTGLPRTTIYDNLENITKDDPGYIYKISVKQRYIAEEYGNIRGSPSKFFVKRNGFEKQPAAT